MNVAIIGCGLIGRKRASVIRQSPTDELVIVADIDESRARALAKEMSCLAVTDWREVVARDDAQAIVVSTVNKFLMPITVAALERGKHVLVEKPMARNLAEAQAVARVWKMENGEWKMEEGGRKSDVQLPTSNPSTPLRASFQLPLALGVGFNHRHHPAIWKAHELSVAGAIGPLMFVRCVYGHGGRPGYDKEWRADPDLAGGGELLDQGVHIVDLCRWFLGEFSEVFGQTATYFWDLGYVTENSEPRIENRGSSIEKLNPESSILDPAFVQLEDNAFAMLRTANGQVATLHTSWTQWKNRFTFEVFGRDGYVIVDGLGGSYGTERLVVGRRKTEACPEQGRRGSAPAEETFEYPGPDRSWLAEWQEFTSAIRENRQPLANGKDGLRAMRLIDAIYESARTASVVRLKND